MAKNCLTTLHSIVSAAQECGFVQLAVANILELGGSKRGVSGHYRKVAASPLLGISVRAGTVDREHGEEGERFIVERVLHFDTIGDEGGKQLWMDVARRLTELQDSVSAPPN